MNKSELIDSIADKADLSKAAAGKALEAVVATVTESLQKGEDVSVIGFGTFGISHRSARTGRNPKTGEAIQIPAGKAPKFKAGKALKDAVK